MLKKKNWHLYDPTWKLKSPDWQKNHHHGYTALKTTELNLRYGSESKEALTVYPAENDKVLLKESTDFLPSTWRERGSSIRAYHDGQSSEPRWLPHQLRIRLQEVACSPWSPALFSSTLTMATFSSEHWTIYFKLAFMRLISKIITLILIKHDMLLICSPNQIFNPKHLIR